MKKITLSNQTIETAKGCLQSVVNSKKMKIERARQGIQIRENLGDRYAESLPGSMLRKFRNG